MSGQATTADARQIASDQTVVLEIRDADRLPADLESSNPRNVSFYERHGFEALGQIQVGSSPTIVPMLRGVSSG